VAGDEIIRPAEPSTNEAVSVDSGLPWATEGAWEVATDIYRIPLPLPMDGLRAVNVYVLRGEDGLVLIDGGWAIPEAREVFASALRMMGARFADIRSFLVTHVHRDHYSMARTLGTELGVPVSLGLEEKAGIDWLRQLDEHSSPPFVDYLSSCGATELAEEWSRHATDPAKDTSWWRYPDTWLTEGSVEAGGWSLEAVHTPGHTPGHYVFADRASGHLFTGDHVLPTITPSIGFVVPPPKDPLADFLLSLAKVRALPDLRVLPAHGPIAPSSHERADELLLHHEDRLRACLEALGSQSSTALDVAVQLPWTRRGRAYQELDSFNRGMAVMETYAHLEVLVARGHVVCSGSDSAPTRFRAAPTVQLASGRSLGTGSGADHADQL
jgi:glyoxylase-like metal-dependent hydrolase (beta-lactamase superfamily II)